jgi:hypothetical protein
VEHRAVNHLELGALLALALGVCAPACVPADVTFAPCGEANACLPGFRCIDGLCAPCEEGGCPGAELGGGVGPAGGTVCGFGDACLVVPAGALTAPITLTIRAGSASTLVSGLELLSQPVVVGPPELVFASPARLEIPISTTRTSSAIAVYGAATEAGPWTPLTGTSTSITAVGGVTGAGVYVAAVPSR